MKTTYIATNKPASANKKHLGLVLSAAILCCFTISSLSAASLYRWTDDNGRVHYGDHVPAEYARIKRQRLNRQGIVVETMAAQKTLEQLKAEALERKRQAELKRAAAEQAERDRILLATYSSIEDIDNARDEKLLLIDGRIDLLDINIKNFTEQRKTILDRITHFTENPDKADDGVLESLEDQLAETDDDLTGVMTKRRERLEEKENIKKDYDAELFQFEKLKLQRDEKTHALYHPLL